MFLHSKILHIGSFETLLKALFTLATSYRCYFCVTNQSGFQNPALTEQLHKLHPDQFFCVDTLEQKIKHISIMAPISIHMPKILWFKAWTAKVHNYDLTILISQIN